MDGPSVNFCGANFWDSPLEKQVFYSFFSPPRKNAQKVPQKFFTDGASIYLTDKPKIVTDQGPEFSTEFTDMCTMELSLGPSIGHGCGWYVGLLIYLRTFQGTTFVQQKSLLPIQFRRFWQYRSRGLLTGCGDCLSTNMLLLQMVAALKAICLQ